MEGVVQELGEEGESIYRPMFQIYSGHPEAPIKTPRLVNNNNNNNNNNNGNISSSINLMGYSPPPGAKGKGKGKGKEDPLSSRSNPRNRMLAMDAGNRFKSTADMLSFTRYRPIPSSGPPPSPVGVGSGGSGEGGEGKVRRPRVVSIYKTNSSMAEDDLFSMGRQKKRPVSIRERSTEIKDWIKENQGEGGEEDVKLEVASDGEGRPMEEGEEDKGGGFPFRRSMTSTVFQTGGGRGGEGAGHMVGLHSRPPVDISVSPPAGLFERSVEKDYIADESALCLFELDVQRDIIVSEGDSTVVIEGEEGEGGGEGLINEDVDIRRSPTMGEVGARRSLGSPSGGAMSGGRMSAPNSPRKVKAGKEKGKKKEKKVKRGSSPKGGGEE